MFEVKILKPDKAGILVRVDTISGEEVAKKSYEKTQEAAERIFPVAMKGPDKLEMLSIRL